MPSAVARSIGGLERRHPEAAGQPREKESRSGMERPDGCLRRAAPQALRLCLGGPRQPNLRRLNGGQPFAGTAPAPHRAETEGEAALPEPPWTRTRRPAVWLPAGGVGGDRPRRPARAGANHGCSRLPHEPKHRENPLPRPGGSTTRPPWPVDPEPAPPAGSHTARRSAQREPFRAVRFTERARPRCPK